METKGAYLSMALGDHYEAVLEKLVWRPVKEGGTEAVVTLVVKPNAVADELRLFVGQPVLIRIKSQQLSLLEGTKQVPKDPPKAVAAQVQAANTMGFDSDDDE